jgi:glycine/D-amino acid oxidase-like deaminating enzyme
VRRRAFLQLAAALPLSARAAQPSPARIIVIGAGAFGGWTALHLLRRGARVTLIDAWGPGNSRASSGGETRVICGVYGGHHVYVELVARAFELWRDHETRIGQRLYRRTGALWMVTGSDDRLEREALPLLRAAGMKYEELSPAAAALRYGQIDFDGVRWALFGHEAGHLSARRACQTVLEAFRAEGGEYVEQRAYPAPASRDLRQVILADGTRAARRSIRRRWRGECTRGANEAAPQTDE